MAADGRLVMLPVLLAVPAVWTILLVDFPARGTESANTIVQTNDDDRPTNLIALAGSWSNELPIATSKTPVGPWTTGSWPGPAVPGRSPANDLRVVGTPLQCQAGTARPRGAGP